MAKELGLIKRYTTLQRSYLLCKDRKKIMIRGIDSLALNSLKLVKHSTGTCLLHNHHLAQIPPSSK